MSSWDVSHVSSPGPEGGGSLKNRISFGAWDLGVLVQGLAWCLRRSECGSVECYFLVNDRWHFTKRQTLSTKLGEVKGNAVPIASVAGNTKTSDFKAQHDVLREKCTYAYARGILDAVPLAGGAHENEYKYTCCYDMHYDPPCWNLVRAGRQFMKLFPSQGL